ncbi:hypothetical protein YC2023_039185 [Brassica napus]
MDDFNVSCRADDFRSSIKTHLKVNCKTNFCIDQKTFRWHSSVVVDIDNTPVHPPLVASIPFIYLFGWFWFDRKSRTGRSYPNWKEVETWTKDVESIPPDGMELKKYKCTSIAKRSSSGHPRTHSATAHCQKNEHMSNLSNHEDTRRSLNDRQFIISTYKYGFFIFLKCSRVERASYRGERMSSFARSGREMFSIRALAVEKVGHGISQYQQSCLLGLSTQKTLIQNRDFLHYNHLPGIVAEVLAQHFPDLQPYGFFSKNNVDERKTDLLRFNNSGSNLRPMKICCTGHAEFRSRSVGRRPANSRNGRRRGALNDKSWKEWREGVKKDVKDDD